MRFSLHPLARADLVRTVEYDECEADPGLTFMEEVHAAVIRLTMNPRIWSPSSVRRRRCRTKRFPFFIDNQVKGNHLEIVAVTNSRRPDYWTGLLNERKAPCETLSTGTATVATPPSRNVQGIL